MRIRFRNALAIGKNYQVKISILMVKDADGPIITQVTFDQVAIGIFNFVVVVPQDWPRSGLGP